MTDRSYLRTHDLAQAVKISVQQVRNYEASGLIPQAARSPSGYRLYTQRHLAALQTVKSMIHGYGWPRTSAIMQALHRGDLSAALTTINERHAELASKRLQIEQTLSALRTLTDPSTPLHSASYPERFRIGEAARQVGVRVSALHFWEQQGLLHPLRDQSSHYRLYDELQMHRLRVVVLLREAGYTFDIIQPVLDELSAGRPEKAIVAVEKKREELTRTSWTCINGLALFQHYVSEFGPLYGFGPDDHT
ncbi:MerR family transcriptional regulator [Tengunoibacter tsumagoiensis]|uniref:MerR family transcriptional regulator n=1 Tax=Tengunoibacter tsumagoiensis TaxID=2014871 RepID=A0A402A9B0_9CHLR|nr:MerR family transcriptional regulator [Tengunoibacter tsumagoiensis]GCE15688.1 MerR family transcriptional regulator [Tengunoibacter tsumagoiensis]